MASRIWVVALGVVALAASCTAGPGARPGAGGPGGNPAGGGFAGGPCTPSGCISLSRLAHGIDSQLKGHVVGYVALIGPSHVVASGLARTAADPPKLAMGPDVMVNVLSVGKMFTTIAVLQSLARHHRSTGSRIWPFLPPDWVKGPGVGTITFGELLTHRAGFRLDSGLVFQTGNAAREQIRHGIQQVDKQVADYNNINFTIFRDLLPFMEGAPRPRAGRARRSRGPFLPQLCAASGLRPGGRHRRHLRAGPPCRAHVPAARRRDGTGEAGPGAAIGVLGGRLVHDTGQHAPGTSGPHQRQPAVTQPTAADGPQLPGLGLLYHQPGRLPGQGRRPFLRRLSVPSDLLRHPRRDDPGGDSHQLRPGKPLFAIAQTALSAATSHR